MSLKQKFTRWELFRLSNDCYMFIEANVSWSIGYGLKRWGHYDAVDFHKFLSIFNRLMGW